MKLGLILVAIGLVATAIGLIKADVHFLNRVNGTSLFVIPHPAVLYAGVLCFAVGVILVVWLLIGRGPAEPGE